MNIDYVITFLWFCVLFLCFDFCWQVLRTDIDDLDEYQYAKDHLSAGFDIEITLLSIDGLMM